tara:strand:+ start:247 stop:648 length:402 start_codon:yes stop_codon:yes gene_type:complete
MSTPEPPTRVPFTFWAQRKDRVFITLECPNSTNPKVNLTDDGVLTFSATAKVDSTEDEHKYELILELLHPVNGKDSQIHVGPRRVTMVVAKTKEVSRREVFFFFFRESGCVFLVTFCRECVLRKKDTPQYVPN